MTWRLAKAIETLRAEVNTAHPDRPKQADGTIGDARHQAEVSDHNPNPPHAGVVTAWDITTAPFTIDLAEHLRALGKGGDLRVKYVIYRGRICSAKQNWDWRPYSGYSQHYDHIHLSVSDDPAFYDSTAPWGVLRPFHVIAKDPGAAQAIDKVRAASSSNPTPQGGPDMLIFHSPSHSYARIPGWVKLDPKTVPLYKGVPVVEVTDAQWMTIAHQETAQ